MRSIPVRQPLPSIFARVPSPRYVRFPGRAGELQELGADEELILELARNYEGYQRFLAAEFEAERRRLLLLDSEKHMEAAARYRQLLVAETLLLRARESHRAPRRLRLLPERAETSGPEGPWARVLARVLARLP